MSQKKDLKGQQTELNEQKVIGCKLKLNISAAQCPLQNLPKSTE